MRNPGWYKRNIKRLLGMGIPVNRFTRPVFLVFYRAHVFFREGIIWAVRFFYYEPLFRSQCKSVGSDLWMEKLPYMVNSGIITIGRNVRLSGKPSFAFSSRLDPYPSISIGNDTFIGHQVSLNVGRSITIGNHCLIAGGVRISDNDGHPLNHVDRMNHLPPPMDSVREVRIGDNVWIGSEAVILKGVSVGDRAVIGTRAVVTKDVPPDTVVAGNPARVIKSLRS